MLEQRAAEQPDAGQQQYAARTAIDPNQMVAAQRDAQRPAPKVSPPHHSSDPSQTPRTRTPPRAIVACSPANPMPAKIARKARIVIGLAMVSAKVDAKSASRPSASRCEFAASSRIGPQRGNPDIKQVQATHDAQPVLITEQPVGDDRKTELAAMMPNTASALAAPSPEKNPAALPWMKVRRTHSTPTGPTGTAMMMPTSAPFSKNHNSIRARACRIGRQSPGMVRRRATGIPAPEGQSEHDDAPAFRYRSGNHPRRVPDSAPVTSWQAKGANMATDKAETGDAYEFEFTGIDGAKLPLAAWRGHPVLVVNTASFCGYTPQYKRSRSAVAALSRTRAGRARRAVQRFRPAGAGHRGRDQAVLRDQLPGRFPADREVPGGRRRRPPVLPLGRRQLGEGGAPRWNFHKYLIGPDGQLAGTWPSQVRPTDAAITVEIESGLPKP